MLYLSQCCVMLYEQFGKVIDIHMLKECKHAGQDFVPLHMLDFAPMHMLDEDCLSFCL